MQITAICISESLIFVNTAWSLFILAFSYVDSVIQSYGNIVIISIKYTYNSRKNELEINSKSVMVMENHKLMSYMQKSVLLMNYELFGFFKISFLKSGIELLMHYFLIGGN